jgi:hypothetical protein
MKRLIIIVVALTLLAARPVFAAPSAATASGTKVTSSPVPTEVTKLKSIDDLKDRLATKVAELRKIVKTAMYGTVKSTTISTMTVETSVKDMKIDVPDDLLVYQTIKGKRTKLTSEDIAKNDKVTVFGDYDDTLGVMKASMVFIEPSIVPVRIVGTVSSVNKTDYSFVIKTPTGTEMTVDFETSTKAQIVENAVVARGGFSKVTVGSITAVIGTANADKPNRVSALRLTVIPTTDAPTPTTKAELSPSSAPTKTPVKK